MKVSPAPPASVAGRAGRGPLASVAAPGPVSTNGGASRFTPLAIAVPVLVTVSVTMNDCPVHGAAG